MKIQSLPIPMEKEEYATSTGAGSAEPLPDMENCCGESCVTGADQLESGAGMPTEDHAAKDAPITSDTVLVKTEYEFSYSLLQIEKDGGDIAGFVGCQVEVRGSNGSIKFAGEMTNFNLKNGIVTVLTELGNRDAHFCEAFVIA